MKKILTSVLAVALIAVMLFTFVGCSSYSAIKSDFEDAGYTLQGEETKEITTDDGTLTVTVHTFKKEGGLLSSLTTAIIWEFSSDKDLEKAMDSNETIKGILKDAQESKMVNGNCILMTINPDAIEIFGQSK